MKPELVAVFNLKGKFCEIYSQMGDFGLFLFVFVAKGSAWFLMRNSRGVTDSCFTSRGRGLGCTLYDDLIRRRLDDGDRILVLNPVIFAWIELLNTVC